MSLYNQRYTNYNFVTILSLKHTLTLKIKYEKTEA